MPDLSYKNPSAETFKKHFGTVAKTAPIIEHPGSTRMDCVRNVEKYIATNGGKPLHVWQVIQQGHYHLQVRPHAIVQKTDDEIIDITPDEYELAEKSICYFENPELFTLPLPPTRHVSLITNPYLIRKIEIMNLALEIHAEVMNKDGVIKVTPEELNWRMLQKASKIHKPTKQDLMLLGECLANLWKDKP